MYLLSQCGIEINQAFYFLVSESKWLKVQKQYRYILYCTDLHSLQDSPQKILSAFILTHECLLDLAAIWIGMDLSRRKMSITSQGTSLSRRCSFSGRERAPSCMQDVLGQIQKLEFENNETQLDIDASKLWALSYPCSRWLTED